MSQAVRKRRVGESVQPRPSPISTPAGAPPPPVTFVRPVRPRAVNTLPPADTFAGLPVDAVPLETEYADPYAAAVVPRPLIRTEGGATMTEVRQRGVTPRFSADPLVALPARIQHERDNQAQDSNGRGRSFLNTLARTLGPAMQQAQQNAARSGREYGAQEFFSGLAGALGGGVAGVVNPAIDERIAQDERVGRLEGDYGRAVKRRQIENQSAGAVLDNQYRVAQIRDVQERPVRERAKLALRAQMDEWRRQNGDARQLTYEQFQQWRMARGDRQDVSRAEFEQAKVELGHARVGLGFATLEEKKANNLRADEDRDADRQQRRQIAAEGMRLRAAALARGAAKDAARAEGDAFESDYYDRLADDLEDDARGIEEAAKAQKGWLGGEGSPTEVQLSQIGALRKRSQRWRDQAHRARAKAPAAPSVGTPQGGGGRYAGQRFSLSQLPTIRQRLGVGSDEEARRVVESQGGVFH